jgi:hypothetical protein
MSFQVLNTTMMNTSRFTLYFLLFFLTNTGLFAQKMLILEQTNKAQTKKYFIGDAITFRFDGPEKYWYTRRITDILPEGNSLLLDNYLVKVDEIGYIKRPPGGFSRLVGGAIFTFGASLTFAATMAVLFRDREQNYPLAYGIAAGSLVTGRIILRKRKLPLGDKYRLKAIEVRFN